MEVARCPYVSKLLSWPVVFTRCCRLLCSDRTSLPSITVCLSYVLLCLSSIPVFLPSVPACLSSMPACLSSMPACLSFMPVCLSSMPACLSSMPACLSSMPACLSVCPPCLPVCPLLRDSTVTYLSQNVLMFYIYNKPKNIKDQSVWCNLLYDGLAHFLTNKNDFAQFKMTQNRCVVLLLITLCMEKGCAQTWTHLIRLFPQ